MPVKVQDEDVALCNQSALEGAMMLDRMDDEDAAVGFDVIAP
jgi:hypothetical protein